jgi:hypothetical protein
MLLLANHPTMVLNPTTTWPIPWPHQNVFNSMKQKYNNNNCFVESPTHDDD